MKKAFLFSLFLLLPAQVSAVTPTSADTGSLDWTVKDTWKVAVKPLDFTQSLDQKLVYILGEDQTVYIYSAKGKKLGSIPVDKNTTAIDIAPQGEILYLMGTDKTYTAIDISFVKKIDVTGSPFLGRKDAIVTMVVFSDFQ